MTSRLAEIPNPRPRFLRAAVLCLLLVLPLAVGAVAAGLAGWDPARAWSAEPAGAPAEDGIDPADIAAAHSALSEAKAQAGFLAAGASQLAKGTGELKAGADELGGGVDKLAVGSQQLHDGLVQLQAGTGQLGAGATELADGVGSAVDQVVGLRVVQGQVLTAIDGTLKDLEGNNSAEARDMRAQLGSLRNQVLNFQLDQSMTEQLTRLKDGSRELSNQLAVSGYAYHDGVYQAVEGSKQLNAGLAELNAKVDEALAGVAKLEEGARKVDGMAQRNSTALGDAARVLPRVSSTEEPEPMLSPIVGMLLAALAVVGGGVLGACAPRLRRGISLVLGGCVGLGLLTSGLLALLASAPTPIALAWGGLAGLLGAGASAALMSAAVRVAGPIGGVLGGIIGLAQVAFVGWVWKATAVAAALPHAAVVAAHGLPLHWAATGVTAAGNAQLATPLWAALAVLAAVSVVALVAAGARAGVNRFSADQAVERA